MMVIPWNLYSLGVDANLDLSHEVLLLPVILGHSQLDGRVRQALREPVQLHMQALQSFGQLLHQELERVPAHLRHLATVHGHTQ
jgi:hypothetical protein